MSPLLRPDHIGILALGMIASSSLVAAAQGPCDIYANRKMPCVTVHSTTRGLYSSYSSPLYQVRQAFDSKMSDISAFTAGGIANTTT